jgi:hypothetical protein
LFSIGLFFCNAYKGQILRWRKRHSTQNLTVIAPCPPMRPGKPRHAAMPAFQPSFQDEASRLFACQWIATT